MALHKAPIEEVQAWEKHFVSCGTCNDERISLQTAQADTRKVVLAAGFAILLVVGSVLWANPFGATGQLANSLFHVTSRGTVAVNQTIDLWDYQTLRGGDQNQLKTVLLPAGLVNLTIVLPRFSERGIYAISVSQDKNGETALASATGETKEANDREVVIVTLDLRRASPGSYFLATISEHDDAPYYYPLEVTAP